MHQQQTSALKEANRIRVARAKLKRLLASGEIDVVDLLTEPMADLATMPIGELLLAQAGWGSRRTTKFLEVLNVRHDKRIGELTVRQLGIIVRDLSPAGCDVGQ